MGREGDGAGAAPSVTPSCAGPRGRGSRKSAETPESPFGPSDRRGEHELVADSPPTHLTALLEAVRDGREGAPDRLFEGVYRELLDMARREFRREIPGHTLQPTALVNEAWMRLAGGGADFQSRAHFFGAAARAMRRILIDHARRAQAAKRGSGEDPVTLSEPGVESSQVSVLEVDEALQALERHDARLAEIVQLRFFGGLTVEEVGAVLGRSPATVKRDWTYARAWLFERMEGTRPEA